MYIVTFYSFKGGVGRSMALVNVGVQLAQSGKRVLLVDFDLEAPGLPSFKALNPRSDAPGLVDYITQYVGCGEAPRVEDFVYAAHQFEESGGEIWVMPVGSHDSGYSSRLNSIDWKTLYSRLDGYLFFEDLKRQWSTSLKADYVLIDSRTGHSDVEGICTRQLPDAVCLLFLPTEQNLQGLKKVVANIRAQNETQPKKVIQHFVVSNVPDLDDEQGILERSLQRFKAELSYGSLAARIHHYNSLSLLNQEIFSLTRPNSSLTKEYTRLTSAITRENLEDRVAVLNLLKSSSGDWEPSFVVLPARIIDKLDQIVENFGGDGEVMYWAAFNYERAGNQKEALTILSDDEVERTYSFARMFALRARIKASLSETDSAIRDLNAMFNSTGADASAFYSTIPIIKRLAPQLFDQLPDSKAFQSLSPAAQARVVSALGDSDEQARARLVILKRLSAQQVDTDAKLEATDGLALAAIASGEFELAVRVLEELSAPEYMNIQAAFNLAMARWGLEGNPPAKLLSRVAQLDEERATFARDANYLECLALTHALLGNNERAKVFLEKSRDRARASSGSIFSAWTYSRVEREQFLTHLQSIERIMAGEHVIPDFISRKLLA